MTTPLDIEDADQLLRYLRETGRIGPRESPQVTVLKGGVSNRTVLVRRPNGQAWVLKQALPKLRVEVDWFSDPRRVHREALAMRWLGRLAQEARITALVFEDERHHLIAMEAVPEPHENWKEVLLAGRVDPHRFRQAARLLGDVHRGARACLEAVARDFGDRSFFESLRLEPYYTYTASQVPEAAPFLERLVADTLACRATLVHGDFSPKNILLHGDDMYLLDHEVAHFGDPTFDIGFCMAHFLSKAHHIPPLRGAFADAAALFWETYVEAVREMDPTTEGRAVRQSLGCLLARVAGRSKLEYMGPEERARQRRVVVSLMADSPRTIQELIERFVRSL